MLLVGLLVYLFLSCFVFNFGSSKVMKEKGYGKGKQLLICGL